MLNTFRDDSCVSGEEYFKHREERVSLTVSFLQKKQHKRMGVVKSRSEMFDDRKHEKITLMML